MLAGQAVTSINFRRSQDTGKPSPCARVRRPAKADSGGPHGFGETSDPDPRYKSLRRPARGRIAPSLPPEKRERQDLGPGIPRCNLGYRIDGGWERNMHRVVITGIGVVAPNGKGRREFSEAILEGRSGVGYITSFDPTGLPI